MPTYTSRLPGRSAAGNRNRLTVCLLAVSAAISIHIETVSAQQSSAAESISPGFTVRKFAVDGQNPISTKTTARILSSYLNREIDIEELRKAATEIEKELAKSGYNFYRAQLPPQTLQDGVVRIDIERINIADVTVTGNDYFTARNITRSLPLVAAGKSPNTQDIANALLLAEDNPAKDVRVVFVRGGDPQTVDANISVQDKNPNEFYLWANNAGSRLATDSRLGVQYHNRNLFDLDHQIALSYTVSPEELDELSQYGINYRIPNYSLRGMFNIFYSKSDADTGRVADVFDISGAGENIGVGYTQYLDKRGDYQHRLTVDVIDKLFDSNILFNSANIGEDVRSRPLTLEYISRLDFSNWLVNSTISYSSNLSGGSFNSDAAYGQVRAGAESDWDKLKLALRFDYRFSRDWRSNILLFAQQTSDALIPGEQMGLGGALGDLGPRGFFEREVTVDKGLKGTLEVARDFPTKRMQLGAFLDFASGDVINPQVGESPDESLSSVGLTARWSPRADLSLKFDYGYILDGVDQTFTPEASDDGDSRLHLSVSWYPAWPWGNK
ncbi:MAG: ShlB/FhaC/HecB family hemolysin secretion/activation protein [Gammaproteobacteria bacterium]|nr:ShlB/FhaC/HecB family hemolysin secretion/activation protein [Gammaproteobacteria bacterium]